MNAIVLSLAGEHWFGVQSRLEVIFKVCNSVIEIHKLADKFLVGEIGLFPRCFYNFKEHTELQIAIDSSKKKLQS